MTRFQLTTEDEEQFRLHLNGPALYYAVQNLDNELRNQAKHYDDEKAQLLRDLLWESMGEYLSD